MPVRGFRTRRRHSLSVVSGRFTGEGEGQRDPPFGHFRLFVHGHEDGIWLGLADFAELLAQKLYKFWFLILGDDGAAVNNNKRVEALVKSHFMLFAEI